MNRIRCAVIATVATAILGSTVPIVLAGDSDPVDPYNFKFLSGTTTTETTFNEAGKPVKKITTIVVCGPAGNDCMQDGTGNFVPKPATR